MRILITNDDGINAPGLKVLEEIATGLAGPEGEVWVVAPAFEQSGVGHCISYTRPMMVSQMGERRFAAEGSPADCVLAAIHDVMADARPDLVLSGVNRGNNSAENALYSGTLGGAMEAALQGCRAVALSQYYGPAVRDTPDPFEAARLHGLPTPAQTAGARCLDRRRLRHLLQHQLPAPPGSRGQGRQGRAAGASAATWALGCNPSTRPRGGASLWVTGAPQQQPTSPGTDADMNLKGYISVTPMRADLTAHDALEALKAIE